MRRLIVFSLLVVGVASAQVVPGVLRHANYDAPPDEGSWSYVEIGSGTCTSVSDVAGTLSITAAGVDADNSCFVYQTVAASPSRVGAQVYGQVFDITGTAASTTLTGAMIRNSIAQNASYCTAWWNAVQAKVKGAVRPADGAAVGGGIDGNAVLIPVHTGVSFVDSTNKCKLYDNDASTVPANELTDFTGVPQPHQSYDADMANSFLAGFIVRSGHATNTAVVTIKDYDVGNAVRLVDNPPDPDANLVYRSDFESGAIQEGGTAASGESDTWLRQTMDEVCDDAGVACPDPADPPRCYTTQSCPGTHSYSDTVVESDGLVEPRAGSYMARLEVRREDYAVGDPPGTSGERSQLKISSTDTDVHLDAGDVNYIGWSVFVPSVDYSPSFASIQFQMGVNPVGAMDNTHFLIQSFIPNVAGNNPDSTTNYYRFSCYYYSDGEADVKIAPAAGECGYLNKVSAYVDEWQDFRVEYLADVAGDGGSGNGYLKIWTRRAQVTDTWTLVVDYTGDFGHETQANRLSFSIYDGGGYPLILYMDELRATNSSTGVLADVDPTPIAP